MKYYNKNRQQIQYNELKINELLKLNLSYKKIRRK